MTVDELLAELQAVEGEYSPSADVTRLCQALRAALAFCNAHDDDMRRIETAILNAWEDR